MVKQLKFVFKYAFGLDQAGNRFTVYPDDTFLVSYPKSGNTWVRFLLGNLIYPNEEVGFSNINRLVPSPDVLSRRFLKKLPRPRILKSHQPFDTRFKKVVYLVRDPRDVVISEYHFNLKKRYIAPDVSLEQFAERFLAGKTADYGSWWMHTASWISARQGDSDFLLVRYEDLLAYPLRETERIALFLAIDANPERLQLAIDRSSADRMRKLEKQQFSQWTGTKNTRAEIPFVRAAKSGGWKESLPPHIAEQIEASWTPMLELLGYEVRNPAEIKVSIPIKKNPDFGI